MQKNKAFTLVELMVAMAIIAVLIGMSVFGISTAQRVLRDNQRRDTVKNFAAALNACYTTLSTYPTAITTSAGGTLIAANSMCTGQQAIPLTGILKLSTTTTSDATETVYCYNFTNTTAGGYQLGVLLEDQTIFNLGSADTAFTVATCQGKKIS